MQSLLYACSFHIIPFETYLALSILYKGDNNIHTIDTGIHARLEAQVKSGEIKGDGLTTLVYQPTIISASSNQSNVRSRSQLLVFLVVSGLMFLMAALSFAPPGNISCLLTSHAIWALLLPYSCSNSWGSKQLKTEGTFHVQSFFKQRNAECDKMKSHRQLPCALWSLVTLHGWALSPDNKHV